MKVRTKHPVTGKVKIVEMTEDEYRANKILDPFGTFRVPDTAIIRYTMSRERLNKLYKDFEDFVADCPQSEFNDNKEAINKVFTLLHKHINISIQ